MQEILIVAGVAALIFGPKQLPKLGRALGETIREFRKVPAALRESADDFEEDARAAAREVNSQLRK